MVVQDVVIKSKEKKFCGLSVEQLQSLSLRDSLKYMPARSRRSLLRHPEFVEKFIKSAEEKISRKKKIRTHLRDLIIIPKMIGMEIAVYNGKSFENLKVEMEMIGHRLGEFALTRQKVNHSAAGIGATRGSKAAKK
ncbi:30S ribosomal protein S19 [Candidatus Pacearchaeota archaeon]|nr:30S ribosomal protein S19 [Candidatus Pacearchaeota archaeon]